MLSVEELSQRIKKKTKKAQKKSGKEPVSGLNTPHHHCVCAVHLLCVEFCVPEC